MFTGEKGEAYEAVSMGDPNSIMKSDRDDSKYNRDRVADRVGARVSFWNNSIW
jgi:hypothetical protein